MPLIDNLRTASAFACALALAGCSEGSVVRVVEGRPQAGRFISTAAYAYYGHAANAEAAGDLAAAKRWLDAAATLDPDGPEVWTRLGALRCRTAPANAPAPVEAIADFDRAAEADEAFAPMHRERARCLLAHGHVTPALAAAERAAALDPDDVATTILRAQALERAGKAEDAHLALRALVVRRPRSVEVWLALLDLAKRTGNAAVASEAALRASELSPAAAARLRAEHVTAPALAAVDDALRARDLEGAQRLAHQARLPWGELALRAVALGRPALAREQAELVLAADPASTSARIALAAAADLAGNPAAAAEALRRIPKRVALPSPLARLVLAEVLARRAGPDAAIAWLGPAWADTPAADADPVLAATAARVRARLSPASPR